MSTSTSIIAWCVVYGVIAFFVCVGNALSVCVFLTNHRLRRLRACVLIINLSVADLVVGAVTLPMYITYQLAGPLIITVTFRAAFDSVDLISGFGSIFSLVVIALERTYSVCLPHRHRATKATAYVICICLVWSVAVILMALRLMRNVLSFNAFFYAMVTCLSTSLVILAVAYLVIWYRIRSNNSTTRQNRQTREHLQERKLAVTLAIVTGVFTATWLPFHILNIIFFACGMQCPLVISLQSVYAIKFLHYVNSLLNPVIYALQLPEFRKTIRKLIRGSNMVYPEITSKITMNSRFQAHQAAQISESEVGVANKHQANSITLVNI